MCAVKVTAKPTPAGLRLDVTVVEVGLTERTLPERSTAMGLLPESEVTESTPVIGETVGGANSTARTQSPPISSGTDTEQVVVIGSAGSRSSAAFTVAGGAVRVGGLVKVRGPFPSFSND